jgi:hypothetical protein
MHRHTDIVEDLINVALFNGTDGVPDRRAFPIDI